MQKVRDKALRTGAVKFYAVDCREEFVRGLHLPGAPDERPVRGRLPDGHLAGPAPHREGVVQVARRERATHVAHGATGKGNDQVRFELTFMALEPKLKVIAPWREWELHLPADLVAYAKRHKIPVPVTAEKPYSSDGNLMHVSYEGGILEDPWREPRTKACSRSPCPGERAPNRAETVAVSFRQGNPVAVNGRRLLSGQAAGPPQ